MSVYVATTEGRATPAETPTTEGTCPETEGPCSQCGKETFVYATDGTRLFSRHLDLHVYPADHEVVFPAYMAPGYGRSTFRVPPPRASGGSQ